MLWFYLMNQKTQSMQTVLQRHWNTINLQHSIDDEPLPMFWSGFLILAHIIGCIGIAMLSHVSGNAALPLLIFAIPVAVSLELPGERPREFPRMKPNSIGPPFSEKSGWLVGSAVVRFADNSPYRFLVIHTRSLSHWQVRWDKRERAKIVLNEEVPSIWLGTSPYCCHYTFGLISRPNEVISLCIFRFTEENMLFYQAGYNCHKTRINFH